MGPLLQAARVGDLAGVQELARGGLDLGEASPEGCTALTLAADTGHSAVVLAERSEGAGYDLMALKGAGFSAEELVERLGKIKWF